MPNEMKSVQIRVELSFKLLKKIAKKTFSFLLSVRRVCPTSPEQPKGSGGHAGTMKDM